MKIFVADDSPAIRGRLIKMLALTNDVQLVGQASDVNEAVDAIERVKPEVVILDIRMPGGSGIEVLRTVKKMEPAPVAIMLTNYSYPQYRTKCLEAGADYFFDKSKEFDKVMHVLSELVKQGT